MSQTLKLFASEGPCFFAATDRNMGDVYRRKGDQQPYLVTEFRLAVILQVILACKKAVWSDLGQAIHRSALV